MTNNDVETMVADFVERQHQKYYGKYRGYVVDNADPEKRARLRLRIPSVLADTETGWALPCLPYGGKADQGTFFVPDVDSQVWVEFEQGELDSPIWVGTFWQQSGDPPAEASAEEPTTRMIKTGSGSLLQFDDADGDERIVIHHPAEAQIEIDPSGTITLTDAQGSVLTLDADATKATLDDANGNSLTMTSSGVTLEDASGNKIQMAASGITVKGQQIVLDGTMVALGGSGGEPIIKGQSFVTMYMTHVHPTAMGPSGPPIPQGELSTLSMKVMTS